MLLTLAPPVGRAQPSGGPYGPMQQTYVVPAGAEIMHGLLHVRIPLLTRRLVTLIPALVVLGIGFDPTLALVLSQVVLSFGIPFALIPLVIVTAQRSVLGKWANRWVTTALGVAASVFLVALNATLLWLVFTG